MRIQIQPLSGNSNFAAELSGPDVNVPLQPEEIATIDAAMDRYGVLILRNQSAAPEQQLAWTRQFGSLDSGFKKAVVSKDKQHDYNELAHISNLGRDGKVLNRNHTDIVGSLANQLWHSDRSFRQPKAKYSMLYCVVPASWGGETEFADMRAAYDALSDRTKKDVENLVAEHYVLHSRVLLGSVNDHEQVSASFPPVHWPIVQTHPGSKRKHLFVGVHARQVLNMTVAEGRMLLMDLLEHATQPAFVHRHEWRPGDLVIWDNRCTLHRGRRFDLSEPRDLRRSTTLDMESVSVAPSDRELVERSPVPAHARRPPARGGRKTSESVVSRALRALGLGKAG
jgi:alpha-ketoglutarate-dependent 2,4-dichlorophenoxyacetate dioxygenase